MISENSTLPSLLSRALAAFIIECDNEFETRVPHRTTKFGSTPGAKRPPWLVSIVMWYWFLRFVSVEGTRAEELQTLVGCDNESFPRWLIRFESWRYLVVEPPLLRGRKVPSDSYIRITMGGRKALEVWSTLTPLLERRWSEQYGSVLVEGLRDSLSSIATQLPNDLPDCLPILGYGMFSKADSVARERNNALPVLLSKLLLAFALEFEGTSQFSFAIGANLWPVIGKGFRVRDLPRLSGVSKEAIAMATGFLEKRGFATMEGTFIKLTPKGKIARQLHQDLVNDIEQRWQHRFGEETVHRLKESLASLQLVAPPKPPPNCWRAKVKAPDILPHYPMILHRGGFPDGS